MKKFLIICLLGILMTGCGESAENFSEQEAVEMQVEKNPLNLETKTVTLNSGYEMPIYGIGTYSLHGEICKKSLSAAFESGVRLIDTAHAYGNEIEVGEAIRESKIPREEFFVITKIYPNQFDNPTAAIEEALKKLNIGYIDMMLLHHPGKGDVEVYKKIEEYVLNRFVELVH